MNMIKKINASQKKTLCDYLKGSLHYSPQMIKQTVKAVNEMEPDIQKMLFLYLSDGSYPMQKIEGVTVKDLVDEVHMNPVAAFLAFDYLEKDPAAAKYALTHRLGEWNLDIEKMEALYKELVEKFNAES